MRRHMTPLLSDGAARCRGQVFSIHSRPLELLRKGMLKHICVSVRRPDPSCPENRSGGGCASSAPSPVTEHCLLRPPFLRTRCCRSRSWRPPPGYPRTSCAPPARRNINVATTCRFNLNPDQPLVRHGVARSQPRDARALRRQRHFGRVATSERRDQRDPQGSTEPTVW